MAAKVRAEVALNGFIVTSAFDDHGKAERFVETTPEAAGARVAAELAKHVERKRREATDALAAKHVENIKNATHRGKK